MPRINHEEYEVLKELDDKWKWIARDDNYGGFIFCFREKPHKDIRKGGWSPGTTQYKYLGEYDLLFQFIQWEDEEPYNVAELIEEYEDSKEYKDSLVIEHFMDKAKESEETEVKRDIKWLLQWIEEYENEVIEERKDNFNGIVRAHSRGKQSAIKKIKQKIDQLDALSLLVPKQEEVDRAYKDGYEEGREHGFYKGYREGLGNKGGEPETVADVVTTFWKSFERLKEVMSMEVEEMEE